VDLQLIDAYATEAQQMWTEIENRARRSFFVSWGWMENWLACLPREHSPQLAVLRDADGPVAAFFVKRRDLARFRVVASRALYLNATGVPQFDEIWIEYNGLAGREVSIGRLIDALPEDWDELFLPGLRPDAFGGLTEAVIRGFAVRIERTVPTYLVDLARVRESGYVALLGRQTRAHLRRAQREAGNIEVEVAADQRQAQSIYDEMIELHTRSWQAKGKPGAFADPWFVEFHRRLIRQRLDHGEIQLIRLRNAAGTIGTLYNFVYDGRVLQYQTGLAELTNPHLRPGFLAHAGAIDLSATSGLAVYDFLAGDMRYKKNL
jgi:CelD/BcsL family acetyltransferase involved in cellulose biosynthesis